MLPSERRASPPPQAPAHRGFESARHTSALETVGWEPDEAHRFVEGWLEAAPRAADDCIEASIYSGAAGVLLALEDISVRRGRPVQNAHDALLALKPPPDRSSSLLGGMFGVRVLQACITGHAAGLEATFHQALEQNNMDSHTGVASLVLAGHHLAEANVPGPWAAMIEQGISQLHSTWHESQPDCWAWTYRTASGVSVRYIGAGHGLVGNAAVLLQLDPSSSRRHRTLQRIESTLHKTQYRTAAGINWPATLGPPGEATFRLNWCHGSPGIITHLAPWATQDQRLAAMLLDAGELVWLAGPHRDCQGLCHGTAGSALALARIHQLTGDRRWLTRAQALAAYAVRHATSDASLWTGSAGVAWLCQTLLDPEGQLPNNALLGHEALRPTVTAPIR